MASEQGREGVVTDGLAEPAAAVVRVWFDYICPWCYLALDRASYLQHRYGFELEWLGYELHPETPDAGIELSGRLLRGHRELRNELDQAGLPIRAVNRIVNTRLILALSAEIRDQPGWESFHRTAFSAYFAQGSDISDREVLAELMTQTGIEADLDAVSARADQILESSRTAAWDLGIGGTPGWQFGDGPVLVGAHPRATFDRVVSALGRS